MPGNIDSGDYRRFWHLACDIAVEYVIDGMGKPCTKRILSGLRQMTYEKLRAEKGSVSAARIYRMLWELPEEEIVALEMEFYTDDHRYWPKKTDSEAKQQTAAENRKKWDKIARQTRMEQERNGDEQEEEDDSEGASKEKAKKANSKRKLLFSSSSIVRRRTRRILCVHRLRLRRG
jgi:hypothetical protein